MANISGTYYSNSSYYPRFTYNISYSEIGRSASSVSYRFNVSFSRSNNWYGYDIQVNWNINGSTGSKQILAANANYSSGSITFDVTTSTNAAGGTLPARIYTTSNTDSTHYQNAIDTGSKTVNKSTFNTPPSISGTVSTNPGGIFSENQSSVSVSWPAATDSNNNLSGYRLRVSINGGGYTELTRTTGRSYSHNISGYGEGTSFTYAVDAYDSYGEWSGSIYSSTIKKNTFTNDTLASTDSINFNTASINFTYSGGNNTQGGVTISRSLTCDNGITVHNGNNLNSPTTVAIYKSGNTPSGPYIKFNDLKARFANTTDKGKGVITFTLRSTNSNGTTKTSNKTMSVNLQANPNLVTNAEISLIQSESTNYLSVASSSNKYFIPDGSRVTRVKWTPTKGALDEDVKYQVYVAYGNGGWNWLADLPTGSSYYNHVVPTQTSSQQFKYLIRSISVYSDSLFADMPTVAQILHYYNPPGLIEGVKTRQSTTCEVKFTVRSVSSIPNINTLGSWKVYKQGTTTPVISSGDLTVSQNEQTITVTGLTESDNYNLVITYNDNTGLTENAKTANLTIGPFMPTFHINKYGVGVGGEVANANYQLKVKGNIGITDGVFTGSGGIFTYTGDANGMGMAIQSGGAMVVGSGESPRTFINTIDNKANEFAYITSDSEIHFVTNCQTIDNRKTTIIKSDGTLNAANLQVGGNNVYHTGRKPTPADIGALASNGKAVNAAKVTTSNNGGFYDGNGDAANSTTANVQIKSWWGIGFAPSISNQPVPQNQNAIWMDVRNGNLSARGEIYAQSNRRVYHNGWCGTITRDAPRVSNLNTIYTTGIYSWSGSGTGTPSSYGVLINIIWGNAGDSNADRYQFAMDSNGVMYIRCFVNKAWTSWKSW